MGFNLSGWQTSKIKYLGGKNYFRWEAILKKALLSAGATAAVDDASETVKRYERVRGTELMGLIT